MKRFGMYNSDFNNLFECYAQVNSQIVERRLPAGLRKSLTDTTSKQPSFPGINNVFVVMTSPHTKSVPVPAYECDDVVVNSDDGNGTAVITARDENRGKTLNIIVSNQQAYVKVYSGDSGDSPEREFETRDGITWNPSKGDLIIIFDQEL